jgi:hypothetical protein
MSNGKRYYELNFDTEGASSDGHYFLDVNQNGDLTTFGTTVKTKATGTVDEASVDSFPLSLAIRAAAGNVNAYALLVTTTANTLSGKIIVNPAKNVPVVLKVSGKGKPIGEVRIPPGSRDANFSFAIGSGDALTEQEALERVSRRLTKPPGP